MANRCDWTLLLLAGLGLAIHTAKGQICSQSLGFEDGKISDSQLTASSSHSIFTAEEARLQNGNGWVPAFGTLHQYLQVDLLTPHKLSQYTVQGAKNSATWFVRRFALYYSLTGLTWDRYISGTGSSVLLGSSGPGDVRSFDLIPPVEARFLVFQPIEGQGLRLELVGCQLDQHDNATYTVIEDDIEDTQNWLLTESPYVINSKIRIKTSGHLNVQPGVTVIFNSTNAGLLVDGTLEAVGDIALPIQFAYPRPFSRQAGQWAGLEVSHLGNLTIEHCNIYGAVTGVKGPLSSITIKNSHIHENSIGVELSTGDSDKERTQLTDTRIANNSEEGLVIKGWNMETDCLQMKNCQIVDNGGSGLLFDSQITLFADNCIFSNNRAHGLSNNKELEYFIIIALNKCSFTDNQKNGFHLRVSTSTFDTTLNVTISESKITDNRADGMMVDLLHPPRGMAVTVENSHIANNKRNGIRLYFYPDKEDAAVKIINNTFATRDLFTQYFIFHLNIRTESTNASGSLTIERNVFVKGKTLWLTSSSGTKSMFANNTITTSTRNPGELGLKVSGMSGDIRFYENRFINCTTGTVVGIEQPVRFFRNVFLNPEAEFDVSLGYDFSDVDRLNVSHNYWGSSDKFYVRSRICDFFCDMTKVIAEVHPFYTTESLAELSTEVDSDLFSFQSEDTIGGILTDSVTLGPHLHLFVNRSLYIPEGYKLTILENVTLMFPYHQGILVQGTIDVQGKEDGKVKLLGGLNNVRWNGLKISDTGSSIQHVVLMRAITGVNIADSKGPVTLTITDSLISGTRTAMHANFPFDSDLALHNVVVNDSVGGMDIEMSEAVTTSVVMSQCRIDAVGGIVVFSKLSHGHFNVSMYSTTITAEYNSCIDVLTCNTKVSMIAEESSFISNHSPFVDLATSLLDIRYREVSASGGQAARLKVCGVTNYSDVSGVIDIQDSSFTSNGNYYGIDIGTVNDGYSRNGVPFDIVGLVKDGENVPHDIILKNNTFSTMSNTAGVHIETGENCSSWNVLIKSNTFHRSGVEINGSLSNATIEQNTFLQGSYVTIAVNFLGNETSVATISSNDVNGGSVVLNSERHSDFFHIEKNHFTANRIYVTTTHVRIHENTMYGGSVDLRSQKDTDSHDVQLNTFNGSQVFIMNPNVIIRKNKFYAGPPLSVFFRSNCFADRQINCSLNYWASNDKDEIANRIHDSKYDTNLPTINFVPFYGFPNLTDLQYLVENFVSSDGTIGGNVGGSVTLTASGSPYTVTASIVVGKLDTLIIEAGVSLFFPKDTGIIVEGTFRILGNPRQFVLAKPIVPAEKWTGVKLLKSAYRPDPSTAPDVRFANGCTGKEGRVEVRKGDKWGTVCGNGFDQNEAKVVCRMLGYDPSINHRIFYTGDFGQGSEDILMGNLDCEGTEHSLDECHMSTFNCSHQQDVALRCNGKLLPRPEDVVNEVELRHFWMMNTEKGLELNGNVTAIENVNSTQSNTHGVTIYQGISSPLTINGMSATNNRYSGLAFEASDHTTDDRYLEVSISKCDMGFNEEYGIHILYGVNMSLHNCQFLRNAESAIYLKSEALIAITQSHFRQNVRGVFNMNEFKRFNGSLQFSLRDSDVTDNVRDYAGVYNTFKFFPVYTERCHYDITNNVFSGNKGNIVFLNTHRSSVANSLYITNNTFQRNSRSIVVLASPTSNSLQFKFDSNIVDNNNARFRESLMKLNIVIILNNFHYDRVGLHLYRNVFSNNRAPEVISISDKLGYQTSINITENIFSNNTIDSTVKMTAYKAELKDNTFNNPLARCELESPVFIRGYDIDARWNYWGSQDVEYIFTKVCGFDTDMARGFIHYLPFYLSDGLTEGSSLRHTHFWISNLHGGVVERQLHLGTTDSPYYITRSIYIRGEGVLAIESGVEIQFQPGTGIYVDGILSAGTSTQERVTLTRASDSSWYGVVLPFKTVGVARTVQLVDGQVPNQGRVEICHNGSWATVCDMSYRDIQLVCQALGYRRVMTFRREKYGEGKGSILQGLECDNNVFSLTDCQPVSQDNTSICNHDHDFGVTCRQFVALTGSNHYSYLEGVSILGSKEGLIIQTPTIRLSNCHINNTEKAGLTLNIDHIDLDLNGTVVEHGQSDGILVTVPKDLRIGNGTTRHNQGNGMILTIIPVKAVIEKMDFISNALHFGTTSLNDNVRLQLKGNLFKYRGTGLVFGINFQADHHVDVFVEDNKFVNSFYNEHALNIWGSMINRLFIRRNTFISTGQISIAAGIRQSVHIDDNTVHSTIGTCFLTLDVRHLGTDNNPSVSVSANHFENITGECVAYLKSNYIFNGSFNYNKILNSTLRDASVLLESTSYALHYNVFDNPSSLFDIQLLTNGKEVINASNNWWGGENSTTVDRRIYDQQDRVHFTPVLMDYDFDCSDAMDCSENGRCVSSNGCWCNAGRSGDNCADFDCSSVDYCSGNGDCVGPSLCNCFSGWKGWFCDVISNDVSEKCISDGVTSTSMPSTTVPPSSDTTPDVSGSISMLQMHSPLLWITSLLLFISAL